MFLRQFTTFWHKRTILCAPTVRSKRRLKSLSLYRVVSSFWKTLKTSAHTQKALNKIFRSSIKYQSRGTVRLKYSEKWGGLDSWLSLGIEISYGKGDRDLFAFWTCSFWVNHVFPFPFNTAKLMGDYVLKLYATSAS